MADIMDLLKGQLSEGLLDQLTQQIGAQDRRQTQQATDGILETLVEALARNTSNEQGASGLGAALDNDHDGSLLDNLNDYIAGGGQIQQQNPRSTNGAGILKHILGGKQSGIIDVISQMSGLNGNQTGNLMTTLAPIVLGMLGKQKRQQNLDNSGLASILAEAVGGQRRQQQRNPQMGMIGKLLDQDGDGQIIDDVAGMLGKLFRKK